MNYDTIGQKRPTHYQFRYILIIYNRNFTHISIFDTERRGTHVSYKTLDKTFHISREQWEELYNKRYHSDVAIHLDFKIKDSPAFFVEDLEVTNLLAQILRLDKEISLLTNSLPGKALEQYSKKCLIDEIVVTNNIEGVRSTRKDISDALQILEQQSEKKDKKHLFLGIVDRYSMLIQRQAYSPKTPQDIRDLYDEILLQEILHDDKRNAPDGKVFRKGECSIYGDNGEEVHRGRYPETEIIDCTEKALSFLHDQSIEPLYRIALFHYLFEYIHPFYDGNGRLGRFIFSSGLSGCLEPIISLRISETIKENLNQYQKAFTICNKKENRGDVTPFLIMMLTMIQSAANSLKDTLMQKEEEWQQYEAMIPALVHNHEEKVMQLYSLLIQAALFSETGITIAELKYGLDIKSYATLQNKLAIIKEQNLLLESKEGKMKYFKIDLEKIK